jgi:DNA (cytosine-5)-methyltransferase 1
MRRKRRILLDLYCGAGGAAMGYHRAGFEIIGVDRVDQPRYPFTFIRSDVFEFLGNESTRVDVVHASPPCQAHVQPSVKHRRGIGTIADTRVDLIPATRSALESSGLPWVIENVMGAKNVLRDPTLLVGAMFNLDVHRPRFFETSFTLPPRPRKARERGTVAVYGALDGRRLWTRADGSELRACRTVEEGARAMGIDWMTWPELIEAVPPAYTEWIGRQLLSHLG